MKRLFIIIIAAVLSCSRVETDNIKPFIPGTYYKKVDNEYNSGFDTLIISGLNENLYQIDRYSSFSRIRNGRIMPLERKTEIWTAVYDKEARILNETKKGKVLSFFPDKDILHVGNSEYKKIKN